MEKLWTFFPLQCNRGGDAIAQYFHCSHIKNRMWSIYFELIILPATDNSSAFNQIEKKRAEKKNCEYVRVHSRINRTQTFSSYSTYRYLFLWILWQCIWCVNLTNGNSAASHTDTLTHREREKIHIYQILFTDVEFVNRASLLSVFFLVFDWLIFMRWFVHSWEWADERLFFRNSKDWIWWNHAKDISFSNNFCISIVD